MDESLTRYLAEILSYHGEIDALVDKVLEDERIASNPEIAELPRNLQRAVVYEALLRQVHEWTEPLRRHG